MLRAHHMLVSLHALKQRHPGGAYILARIILGRCDAIAFLEPDELCSDFLELGMMRKDARRHQHKMDTIDVVQLACFPIQSKRGDARDFHYVRDATEPDVLTEILSRFKVAR